MINLRITALLTAFLGTLVAWANQPDSVYLFGYSAADGKGGLKLAWSTDKKMWHPLVDSKSVVNSDFGPWGSMKTMLRPELRQEEGSSRWVCSWHVLQNDSATAFVSSPDLKKWSPQVYTSGPATSPISKMRLRPAEAMVAIIGGKTYDGYATHVAWPLIEDLQVYTDSRRYREQLYSQLMKDDLSRFANLKPVEATLCVYPDSTKNISDKLIGIFFEDINYSADGGLYAELIQNRDFEYSHADRHNWDSAYAWTALNASGDTVAVPIDEAQPLNPNNPHYAKAGGLTLINSGFDGITLARGETYRLSFFALGKATINVSLEDGEGRIVACRKMKVSASGWKKFSTNLIPDSDVKGGSLKLSIEGDCYLDMISLFPKDTFNGRENGLRRDIAQALADLKPKFIRFPGGCVAHGNGIDNIYDWKGSIGPLEARKPLSNLWGYHQTRGLGYHEYFLFCEDIGAEPLPVLAAGVPCQNSGHQAHHSHDAVTCYGQQGGIPLDEMPAYIQDVLDLIEYANGDAKTTRWGRERALAGHPKPFNLKYIGIGNEDMITEVFEERFAMISDAVKKAYPDVKIVGTVGPFYEGTDYDRGWEFSTKQNIPIVDEHYYVSPGWLIHNNSYYDSYDRSKPHVYLGEYASHMPDRASNLEAALSNAIYLTGVERNADVVELTSYAPLLAKKGHTQWRPDLIYFTNDSVFLTPDYEVQKMYGNHAGNIYVNSSLTLDSSDPEVNCRVGASVVYNSGNNTTVIRLANLLPVVSSVVLDIPGIDIPREAKITVISGEPSDTHIVPVTDTMPIATGTALTLSPYSFTIIEF